MAPSAKLDLALDDVIESSSWGGSGGKGSWGSRGGDSGGSWGRGGSNGEGGSWARGGSKDEAGSGSRGGDAEASNGRGDGDRRSERGGGGDRRSKTSKLDMSLDEVIETSGDAWLGKSGSWGSKGKGKGHGTGWNGGWSGKGGGKGSSSGPPRWQPPSSGGNGSDGYASMSSWQRMEQERGGERYGLRRGRGEDKSSHRHVKRIKVANLPRDLAARDIKHAFEAEAGKTTSCELERGVAYLTFVHTEDARKAVETFDRGELNGKTITVTLEP